MLSIRDCLDYCDLTDEDVAIIAEHHDIPDAAAAQIACGLVQTREGTLMLTQFMLDLVDAAEERGDRAKAKRFRDACARFIAAHPLPHESALTLPRDCRLSPSWYSRSRARSRSSFSAILASRPRPTGWYQSGLSMPSGR
jgi:hypothetical protein